ncbi:hypothetical protein PybrP1_010660 [[Pythium] brassicae (nom. inval.)]|nr:hypothetical protein PybrP1_010660 [[Pythium] brassicae (nom. inval.)]
MCSTRSPTTRQLSHSCSSRRISITPPPPSPVVAASAPKSALRDSNAALVRASYAAACCKKKPAARVSTSRTSANSASASASAGSFTAATLPLPQSSTRGRRALLACSCSMISLPFVTLTCCYLNADNSRIFSLIAMDAVAQEQLLALAATAGRAPQLFARLAPLVAGNLPRPSQAPPLPPQLALLQRAFGPRLEARVRAGLCVPLAPATGGERQSAALAAKVAQRVIRTYAAAAAVVATGTADSDRKQSAWLVGRVRGRAEESLCVALKLGELVVDNMLYQVAKKYAELPQVRCSHTGGATPQGAHAHVVSCVRVACGRAERRRASRSRVCTSGSGARTRGCARAFGGRAPRTASAFRCS